MLDSLGEDSASLIHRFSCARKGNRMSRTFAQIVPAPRATQGSMAHQVTRTSRLLDRTAVNETMKRTCGCLALGLIVAAVPLAAQSEREDVHLRNECRLASQVLLTGHPAPRQSWAYGIITRCDESGASTLATTWTDAPPSDEETLRVLAGATRSFPVRRVFDALCAVASDGQFATAPRVYAISVLASFARPGIYLNIRDLFESRDGYPPGIVSISGDQKWNDTGDLAGSGPETRTLLIRLVKDSDPVVARAATWYLLLIDAE